MKLMGLRFMDESLKCFSERVFHANEHCALVKRQMSKFFFVVEPSKIVFFI